MRSLHLLFVAFMASPTPAGFPVYKMLKENTYSIPGKGTSFTVSYEGTTYMVTNWHVCRDFTIAVALNEKNKIRATIKVLKMFPDQDLCVMETTEKRGLQIGSDVGSQAAVYEAGYPQYATTIQLRSGYTIIEQPERIDYGPGTCPEGFEVGATVDPISHKTVQTCIHSQDIMDTNLEGTGGNSGSPVVNSKGQLVGIVHSHTYLTPNDDHHNTLNYIPVRELVKVLKSLKTESP